MTTSLTMWGGVECTVNRLRNSFRSQLAASGHDERIADLELFAQLGIARIRYPVLWELVSPKSPQEFSWTWSDERLQRLRELRVEPIVGLLHHGSGPIYTNLLDPNFPTLFSQYAYEVATRYPWVSQYTPINEPLTTARFSCLYGHWYPHARSDAAFARALLNQCRATVLAMQAIRRVNPSAQLIATDDLGQTFSTAGLQYQADFENERRWLGWDLISGKVDRRHPLRKYLSSAGIGAAELDWLCANGSVPDVIGINHYITSDRMLHEQWQHFPESTWGGNGIDRYADTEAVRVLDDYVPGFDRALTQTSERYKTKVALTEVHLGCAVDEQVRWLNQAWMSARSVRSRGVPVIGVTSWALLGSYDWNSLLTREEGHYEPGAFDLSDGSPRITGLSRCIRQIARHGAHAPTGRVQPGWWERESRITVRVSASA
ncbi:MAG TPA: family 1 glycosylhydrolase [Steroidobacteraceae bacterium]|nr:family 1 glycosylhydrolase [Steroidobacteraceae bacterium]